MKSNDATLDNATGTNDSTARDGFDKGIAGGQTGVAVESADGTDVGSDDMMLSDVPVSNSVVSKIQNQANDPTYQSKPLDPSDISEIERAVRDYRVIRTLSESPTSVVYKAEHKRSKRPVAIKVAFNRGAVDAGRIERARVEIERAKHLNHDGIARLVDAGLTDDGHCYLISDFVKGVSLDEYVSVHKLSFNDRLTIMTKIGEAVQYAHQRCTLHRDLRPSNIVIDGKCNPCIVGFGVAAVTGVDIGVNLEIAKKREFGEFLAYKSPEQVQGRLHDVDVRSDVYSLGVISFELLTGTLPYHVKTANPKDFVETIANELPPKPGSIKSELRGDLEAILLKSLEKQPESRYQTVADVLHDLNNYFQERPITARSAGALYEFRKLASRYRSRTISVFVLMAAMLAFGIHVHNMTRSSERTRLEGEIQRAEESAVNVAMQRDIALSELAELRASVGKAHENTDTLSNELDGLRASLSTAQAEVATQSKRAERAETVGAQAVRTASFFPEMFAPEIAGKLFGADKAVLFLDDAAQRAALEYAEAPSLQAALFVQISSAYQNMKLPGKAAAIAKTALGLFRDAVGENHEDTIGALNRVTSSLFEEGKYKECEPYAEQLVNAAQKVYGATHPRSLTAKHNLGMTLFLQNKVDKAGDALAFAVEGRRDVLGEADARTVASIHALAVVRFEQQRLSEAAQLFREEIAALTEQSPGGHWMIADARSRLGACLASMGEFDEAENLLLQSHIELRDTFGATHPTTIDARDRIVAMYNSWGRKDLAEQFAS